jgi:hypothetical protein
MSEDFKEEQTHKKFEKDDSEIAVKNVSTYSNFSAILNCTAIEIVQSASANHGSVL